ncbi:MAG TPA: hypothetical protein ENI07_07795 [Desulfobacterales bacterium]|nr:hypothetical protein [Desulfobacterales bacterium]
MNSIKQLIYCDRVRGPPEADYSVTLGCLGPAIVITSSLSSLRVGDTATHVGDIPTSYFIWCTICVNFTHTKIFILLFKIDADAIAEKYLSYQIVKTCPTDDVFLSNPDNVA